MTESILSIFFQISTVPRPSRHESLIRDWLVERAEAHRWTYSTDDSLNVLMNIPPSPSMKHMPPVMLQTHSDMVAERDPLSTHNFLTDPIPCYRDGDWIRSRGTTLGADNGIGMSMALGIAESSTIDRPPLLLLFTANEEAGMTGIRGVDPSWLQAPWCINLDSSSEEGFTIGSAGGASLSMVLPLQYEEVSSEFSCCRVSVSGLRGGHSGGTASRDRLSALTVIWDILGELMPKKEFCVQGITSDHARNAVSSHAEMMIAFPDEHRGMLERVIALTKQRFSTAWQDESGLVIAAESCAPLSGRVLQRPHLEALYELGRAVPQGVMSMDPQDEYHPLLSANWPYITCNETEASFGISIRGAAANLIHELITKISLSADSIGAVVNKLGEHPPWPPDRDSRLLSCAVDSYRFVEQRSPVCRALHAGLECGWIHQAVPEMEIISMGALIEEAHTPQERLRISSIEKTVSVVKGIFSCLASGYKAQDATRKQ